MSKEDTPQHPAGPKKPDEDEEKGGASRTEKGQPSRANPLAPPINNRPGS